MSDMEARKIFRVGDSLAITIPTEFLAALEWKEGDYLKLTMDKKAIIVEKVK